MFPSLHQSELPPGSSWRHKQGSAERRSSFTASDGSGKQRHSRSEDVLANDNSVAMFGSFTYKTRNARQGNYLSLRATRQSDER